MTDKPYCFSQDYELAVTVSSISGPKDLMRMAYGTKEPRHVIEQAMKEIVESCRKIYSNRNRFCGPISATRVCPIFVVRLIPGESPKSPSPESPSCRLFPFDLPIRGLIFLIKLNPLFERNTLISSSCIRLVQPS
jgi:hypothetical protein